MLLNYFQCFVAEILCLFIPKLKHVQYKLPYFSQWESPQMVDQIINHKIKAVSDPKWKDSGANDPKDYEKWSWNICGMACLKMVLVYKFHKNYQLVKLAKQCSEYGGYIPQQNIIDGLFYQPFCRFVKDKFGLSAKTLPILTTNRIKHELNRNNFIIASVNANIRDENTPTPQNKSGHLVLITGYNENKKLIYLHNPSGFYKKSQKNYQISETDFSKFFGHKGIMIFNEKDK